MKFYIFLSLCGIVFCSLAEFSLGQNNDLRNDILPREELVHNSVEDDKVFPAQQQLIIFPKEIFFGDVVYIAIYNKNKSMKTIKGVESYQVPLSYQKETLTVSIKTKNEPVLQYKFVAEYDSTTYHDYILKTINLSPGASSLYCKGSFDFPPLEDMEHPFWKEVLAQTTPDGVHCQLHIEYYCTDRSLLPQLIKVDQDIRIKPRPESEMNLLKKWYKNTPENLFPMVKGNRKLPRNNDSLFSNYRTNLFIGDIKGYDPWSFIRLGYRKPSDLNCPKTIEGWQKLESELIPSTMRDEIRLIRMQLEYYGASYRNMADVKKKALGNWLKSLPNIQQNVMISYLVDLAPWFRNKGTTLHPKYLALLRELYDQLDDYGKGVAYSLDRSFPRPAGILKLIDEVIKPTESDLALKKNDKDSEDGFRVWKIHTPNNDEYLFVAKFNSLTEDAALEFQSRDGRSVLFELAALDKNDIIYIEQTYPGKLPQEDYREWKGKAEGLPVTATYFGLSGGMVRVKKKDEYKPLGFEFNKLSNEDQLYVQSRQKNPREFLEREWTVIYVDGEPARQVMGKFVSADEEFVTFDDYVGAKRVVKLSNISEKDRDYVRLCQNYSEKTFSPPTTNDPSSEPPTTFPPKTVENSDYSTDILPSSPNNEKSSTSPNNSSLETISSTHAGSWWVIIAAILLLLLFTLVIIGIYIAKIKRTKK